MRNFFLVTLTILLGPFPVSATMNCLVVLEGQGFQPPIGRYSLTVLKEPIQSWTHPEFSLVSILPGQAEQSGYRQTVVTLRHRSSDEDIVLLLTGRGRSSGWTNGHVWVNQYLLSDNQGNSLNLFKVPVGRLDLDFQFNSEGLRDLAQSELSEISRSGEVVSVPATISFSVNDVNDGSFRAHHRGAQLFLSKGIDDRRFAEQKELFWGLEGDVIEHTRVHMALLPLRPINEVLRVSEPDRNGEIWLLRDRDRGPNLTEVQNGFEYYPFQAQARLFRVTGEKAAYLSSWETWVEPEEVSAAPQVSRKPSPSRRSRRSSPQRKAPEIIASIQSRFERKERLPRSSGGDAYEFNDYNWLRLQVTACSDLDDFETLRERFSSDGLREAISEKYRGRFEEGG